MSEIKPHQVLLLLNDASCRDKAEKLSLSLGIDCVESVQAGVSRYLVVDSEYVGLRFLELGKHKDMFIDFTSGRIAHRQRQGEGRGQTLARAIGIKGGYRPRVLDVTAGLGRDAFVLASLGCDVTLVERSPYLFHLLEDGIRRALEDESTAESMSRMRLLADDARALLQALGPDQLPDVIYMDPMYPHREKSALVKKEMRIIRAFVGDDEDTEELLRLAITRASKRIVVKRPKAATPIPGLAVNFTVASKNTRYDVYLPQR